MTESFDSTMRTEIAFLHDRVVGLERQFEAARTDGDPAEVRRLRPLLDEAREHWWDAEGMPALGEAATALHYREGEGWRELDGCLDALDRLLYHHGGDGVFDLEVVEASPTRVTLVGQSSWVTPIDGNLVEATFTFDQDSRAITRIVVRAGEDVSDHPYRKGARRDDSPRRLAKRIANRPESDEQWAVVIRAPSA